MEALVGLVVLGGALSQEYQILDLHLETPQLLEVLVD